MTVITFNDVLNIVAQKRGPLIKGHSADVASRDYRRVWEAFNRYLCSVLSELKGMHVINFCTVCLVHAFLHADE
jgi:hypothetical protein